MSQIMINTVQQMKFLKQFTIISSKLSELVNFFIYRAQNSLVVYEPTELFGWYFAW